MNKLIKDKMEKLRSMEKIHSIECIISKQNLTALLQLLMAFWFLYYLLSRELKGKTMEERHSRKKRKE